MFADDEQHRLMRFSLQLDKSSYSILEVDHTGTASLTKVYIVLLSRIL